MFIQVYFHRTRQYFDIMLGRALKSILPNGTYPKEVQEYLKWDDCKVLELLKEKADVDEACRNIVERHVYPRVFHTKAHPLEADIREFERNYIDLQKAVGKQYLIVDKSAGKMPHKIPKRIEVDNEKAIIIYDKTIEKRRLFQRNQKLFVILLKK